MKHSSNSKTHLSRLQWACRRGMLELDFILQKFLNEYYLKLSAEDQQEFEKLLTCNDQELYNWLVKKQQPNDEELRKIIEMVRKMSS